ncbi:hypothetical protein [Verrucosispora sp. NA02020]|uniref:hypothetical protein n=1 Tax=Verrucosispora sp. NA02020 TaxID=2742132 RepID=UPI003D73F96F
MTSGSPRLLGGEMLAWSDLDGSRGPGPVGGPTLTGLLTAVGGRTLVVGPHHPDLLDAVPSPDLTILVRGLPDAETLTTRYADRPEVQVYCGSPEKLPASPQYDTLVALDGLGRLTSVEGSDLSWTDLFDLLVSMLRPTGRLLLGAENLLGLHRLPWPPPERTDSDWTAPEEYDHTRPGGLPRLRDRLAASGLWTVGTWATFPGPRTPTALLGTDLLADTDLTGFLQAALSATDPGPSVPPPAELGPLAELGRSVPPLADPARLAVVALRHGGATELAPGWVVLAERLAGTNTNTNTTPERHDDSDEGADPVGSRPPAAVLSWGGRRGREVHRGPAGGWRYADGAVVPSGRTAEDLVLAATARREVPALRALLTAWQAGPLADVPADQVVVPPHGAWHAVTAAEPTEVVRRAYAEATGRTESPTGPVEGESREVGSDVVLRRLASRMIDAGLAYLWPAGELTSTLATLAGRDPVPFADDRAQAVAGGWRELLVDRDELAREVAEARALAQWYERTLTERDRELTRLRRIVSLVSGTPTARAGRILLAGARTARRTARTALHHLRHPT